MYSKLKFEAGVHRVQRVPATETQVREKGWVEGLGERGGGRLRWPCGLIEHVMPSVAVGLC